MIAFHDFTQFPRRNRRSSGTLRGCALSLAVTAVLGGLVAEAQALGFPAVLNLGSLDGSNGFKLDGEAINDLSGISVGAAGDVNGDGVDDLIVGASGADPSGASSGRSYVVFGKTSGFASPLQLSALNGAGGFKIDGESMGDGSGRAVGSAGDVNGDGVDDLFIGAVRANPSGASFGRSYVVFGKSSGFVSPLQLTDLNGNNGFKLDGEAVGDQLGRSIDAAGDFNGDGIDDLVIGAHFGAHNGANSGRTYVVFGTTSGFASSLQLSALNGSNGLRLDGEINDNSGYSVSAAGDVNGDGMNDLVIGAIYARPNGPYSGRSYVVFGRVPGSASPLQLSMLDGSNGFKLDGEAAYDFSGNSVSGAGDINGDGVDDLLVGAVSADPNGPFSGRSYVVFGNTLGFAPTLQLSALNGNNGFKLDGAMFGDRSGNSVSAAGDINGDGVDDLIVGSYRAGTAGNLSGRSHVVFGNVSGFPTKIQLSALDGGDGFSLEGETAGDGSGNSVSAAGDINGDGVDDLIVAAVGSDPNGSYSGRSYVVFGRVTGTPVLDFGGVKLVEFGGVPVGATSPTRTVTLSNPGSGMLLIDAIAIPNPAFTVIGGSCGALPIRIRVDASCTLDVRFVPQAEGFALTQVSMESTSVTSPDSIFLQGFGENVQLFVDGFEGN